MGAPPANRRHTLLWVCDDEAEAITVSHRVLPLLRRKLSTKTHCIGREKVKGVFQVWLYEIVQQTE